MTSEVDLSVVRLVWISIKPLIKILLPGLVGAALLRCKKLDDHGLKTAALIQIFGALPCLVFANIVPSMTAQNSSSIGVCVGFGLFYMLTSYIFARILMIFVIVPENFRNGFLVAAIWSNWGNLPISVIQSLAAEPPFGKPMDDVLGVAYGSFFITLHNLTMFAGPGTTMIERDFLRKAKEPDFETCCRQNTSTVGHSIILAESGYTPDSVSHQTPSPNCSSSDRESFGVTEPLLGSASTGASTGDDGDGAKDQIKNFFSHLISPVNVALFVSMIIAVCPPLKALFVVTEGQESGSLTGPDGKPVLSVLLDSTEYLGASAIPLALIVTGASFAKMSLPRSSWSSLPIGAIVGLTVIKLVLLPLIGFGAVAGIDKYTNVFEGEEARILKMICLYYSCTVTSTNQISLTSIAASDSESGSNIDLLCAFIVVQYLIYPVVGTAVIAAGIQMVI